MGRRDSKGKKRGGFPLRVAATCIMHACALSELCLAPTPARNDDFPSSLQLEQVPSLEPGPAEPGELEDLLPVLNGTASNGN